MTDTPDVAFTGDSELRDGSCFIGLRLDEAILLRGSSTALAMTKVMFCEEEVTPVAIDEKGFVELIVPNFDAVQVGHVSELIVCQPWPLHTIRIGSPYR